MNICIGYDRPSCIVTALLAFSVGFHFAPAMAQSPDDATNLELVRALKSAVKAIESLPAFDVAGLTTTREDFSGEGKRPVAETFRFRMQVAHDRKVLRYVSESRKNRASRIKKAGEPTFSSVLIRGGTVQYRSMFLGAPERSVSNVEEFPSFDEAITSGGGPAPGYWGLYDFPFSEDGLRTLSTWIEQVSSGNTTVTAQPKDGTIRYVAQIDYEPGKFDILHWEFKLPTYLPTFFKLERAIREGRARTYREQKVDYTVLDGHEVPHLIQSWNPRRKRVTQGWVNGRANRLTELKWLRLADDAIDASPMHPSTLEEVRPFLDEGIATVPIDLDSQ